MLAAAGQSALSAGTQALMWLKDRFKISIELADADVETVGATTGAGGGATGALTCGRIAVAATPRSSSCSTSSTSFLAASS